MSNNVAGRTVRVAAVALLICLGLLSDAQAQAGAPFTDKQCSDAISIANALVQRNKARISAELIDSFLRFSRSKCDLNTDWKLVTKTDEAIFGEFRVRLVALRL